MRCPYGQSTAIRCLPARHSERLWELRDAPHQALLKHPFGAGSSGHQATDIFPWAGSNTGTPPQAIAASLTKSAPFCVLSGSAISPSHARNVGTSIETDLPS